MSDPWATPPSDGPGAPPPPPPPGSWPVGSFGSPPQQPPPGYGPPPGYWQPYGQPAGWYGPPGQIRRTGLTIALFIVTLGIYGYVYNYQVHTEMKRHSARGVGGGVALLLSFLANIAMPFVTAAEVGSLYSRRGEQEPVNGWTGLWFLVPAIVSYVGAFITVLATFAAGSSTDSASGSGLSTSGGVALGVGVLFCVAIVVAGALTWFIKTNGALNRYWESVGVTP